MRGDVQEVGLGALEGRDLGGEADPVQSRDDACGVLAQTAKLVVAEDRTERPGDDDHRAAPLPKLERNYHVESRAPGRRARGAIRLEQLRPGAQRGGVRGADPTRGQHRAVRVEHESGFASDQALRPPERPFRERFRVRAVQQQVVQGAAELLFV